MALRTPLQSQDGAGASEQRLLSTVLTDEFPNGTVANGGRAPRSPGLYYGCVITNVTIIAGGALVRTILEGSNDGTTWFILAQTETSAVILAINTPSALNESLGSIVEFARFRHIRVRCTDVAAVPGTFTATVLVTGVGYGGNLLTANSATLTRTGATVNGAAFGRPQGVAVATVVAVLADFGVAAAYTVNLQGSPDGGTTWITIASSRFTGNATQLVGMDGSDFLVFLGGFETFRYQVVETGGAGTFTVNGFLVWDSADMRTGHDGIYDSLSDGEESNEMFIRVDTPVLTAEALNVRTCQFALLQNNGSPLAQTRRVKISVYDTIGSGDTDLASNATITAIGTGTAIGPLGGNQFVARTADTGIIVVSITDLAVETVFATLLDDGVPIVSPVVANGPAVRQCIVQTTEAQIAYI